MGSHSESSVASGAAGGRLPTTVSPSLRPFQRRFLRRALAPGVDVGALSLPRGGGKSWLAAHILQRCLTPDDNLFVHGAEYLLCSGSLEQARIVFRFLRTALEPTGEYRWLDSDDQSGRHSQSHKHPAPGNVEQRQDGIRNRQAHPIVICR